MAATDIQVINDYGLTARTRVSNAGNRGKTRYSITIKSEPILVNTDPRALTRQIADATEKIYKERIAAISETAKPATIKARESARKAVVQGEAWAMRRYSGGRIGTRVPGKTDRLFNDSGRLLESIKVGATSKGWVVNIAANRLDPSTFDGGEAAMAAMVERLRQFVPEWGDPRRLGEHLEFRRALKQSLADALAKANERTVQLKMQLMQVTVGRLLRLVA